MRYLVTALALAVVNLSAQGIRLEAVWSTDTVLVGEPVDLIISAKVGDNTVPHFSGLTFTNPEVSLDSTRFGPLSVTYSFTFWAVGKMALPGIPVYMEQPDGTVVPMTTDSLSVMVVSSLTGAEQDIREIKEMVPLSLVDAGSLWRRGIALGALILIAVAIWVRRRRGHKGSSWKRSHPGEAALQALGQLRRQVYHPYDAPENYQRLSSILRGYLAARFVFRAMEMTTTEIKDLLPQKIENPAVAMIVSQLLEQCDLAKFARQKHPQNKWRNDLDQAQRIIEKTRPAIGIQEATP
ncbi:MAG: hypothetical protein IID15_02620 [Candidatus Marinimicrobia bacterium]|nr:hypothetical protein [Candidatus Neomarinimicrobiota bacterium]